MWNLMQTEYFWSYVNFTKIICLSLEVIGLKEHLL
jgi:hypothetical protein